MARIARYFPTVTANLLLILLLQLSGCNSLVSDQNKRQLRDAAKLLEQESYPDASAKLEKLLQQGPPTTAASEAHYMLGLCNVPMQQPDQARRSFQNALQNTDLPILKHYIRLSLANLAFEQQDYSKAAQLYGPYLDSLPRRPPFHWAYYRYGLVLQATGNFKQADVQFARIIHLFPDTDVFDSARNHFGKTHYTIELGHFPSLELAEQQQKEFPDLAEKIISVTRPTTGNWFYVNLYGKFETFPEAKQALASIKNIAGQARIVPMKSSPVASNRPRPVT